jgi:hypothetical protein
VPCFLEAAPGNDRWQKQRHELEPNALARSRRQDAAMKREFPVHHKLTSCKIPLIMNKHCCHL